MIVPTNWPISPRTNPSDVNETAMVSLRLPDARIVLAQDATPVAEEDLTDSVHLGAAQAPSEFLFVQSFAGGSIVPADGADGSRR